MNDNTDKRHLTFGFDIGIASVGWAVLAADRIIDLGVRCFDVAEVPKTGASLNEHRRLMRTARTRLARRAWRLKSLRRLLRDAGLVTISAPAAFETAAPSPNCLQPPDPWQLRAEGLDRELSADEWARVLYHLVKHRGFFAARKRQAADQDDEAGKLLRGVKATEEAMNGRWRTLGEMAARDPAFTKKKRNTTGTYERSFSRLLLGEELRLLFERQRDLGSAHADVELQSKVERLFWFQQPALSGEAMLAMIGRCTFERDEYRSPKRSFTAERFVWLSKLNNLRIVEHGERRPLTEAERAVAMPLPYRYASGKLTYRQLRRAMGLAESASTGFAGLSYGTKRNRSGEPVDPEEATLVELKGWHDMRMALSSAGLTASWQRFSAAALDGDPSQLDAIALAVAIHKTDDELAPALRALGFTEAETQAVLALDFTEFLQLSTKALRRMLPMLEAGQRYDQAKENCGYRDRMTTNPRRLLPDWPHHFESRRGKRAKVYEVGNPVVRRSLNQARKVLNALIETYGSPSTLHVELARDLAKPFDERREIKRGQDEFQAEKQRAFDYFVEQIGRRPRGDELLKMRLYREQDGQCAYSQQPLAPFGDLRLMPDACEIDHVLPYSRSFDDSQNNKVLVLTRENREKGNRTPYEYLDGSNASERWRQFEAWVSGHRQLRKAKRDRLLRRHFDDAAAEEFRNRNLEDTRYVTRYFAEFVRQNLIFAPGADGQLAGQPVLYPSGSLTGFLRARWGLAKDRGAGDLHHAVDACVVAAATPALVKRVSDFARRDELLQLSDGSFADRRTGEVLGREAAAALGERFPQPWPMFADEVRARLSEDPRAAVGSRFATYGDAALAAMRAVFVSRAVKRSPSGAIHQETVRSVKSHLGPSTSAVRAPLSALTLASLERVVGAADARNAGLMTVLRERLHAHGGDGKKAFGPSMPPVHKPLRDGSPGPEVRSVKLTATQAGGVPVRGGVADQASIWRVDVFFKGGKHYLVPVYASERRPNGPLPVLAATAGVPRSKWTKIDDSFEFRFSLHTNDGILLAARDSSLIGYFAGLNVNTASISIAAHDRNPSFGKDGQRGSIGVKLGITAFEKFHVDVLGRRYAARQETRRDLA